MPYPDAVKIADLQGQPVLDQEGSELGNVSELVIDMRTGCITYAVVSTGGFLGIGDQLFAVPWHAFVMDQGHFVLQGPRQSLEGGDGFDREHWPEMDDPGWARDIHRRFGLPPKRPDAVR